MINVLPDPSLPITFDSLVEQYVPYALKVCRENGRPETDARVIAEVLAQTDIEIIRDVMTIRGCTAHEALLSLLPIDEDSTRSSCAAV